MENTYKKLLSSAQKWERICGRAALIKCEILGAWRSQLSFQKAELDEKRKNDPVNVKRCRKDEGGLDRQVWKG